MDRIEYLEKDFFDKALLETEYFKRYRKAYYWHRDESRWLPHVNYDFILSRLIDIYDVNQQHAFSYTKRFKADGENILSCESITSELLVYAYYIPLKREGMIKDIDLHESECDVIISEMSGEKRYYEVLMIKPDLKLNEVNEIRTHRQTGHSSLRQKILNKIEKHGQLSKQRKNIAAINLNDIGIAGDFHVLSSLSDGLKIPINRQTGELGQSYVDWEKNLFQDERTNNIYAIEWFDLGDYALRRSILNPYFRPKLATESAG